MENRKINSKRRIFLTAATCGPALAVAALMNARREVVQGEAAPPVRTEPETSVGYHETEHIRNYYSTAAYF
jgi:hypothetical protein